MEICCTALKTKPKAKISAKEKTAASQGLFNAFTEYKTPERATAVDPFWCAFYKA